MNHEESFASGQHGPEHSRRRRRIRPCGQVISGFVLAIASLAPVASAQGLTVLEDDLQEVGAVHSLALKAADGRQQSRSDRFAVGDRVEICFGASRKGFVSLWSQDANGVLDRLVPNRYTPPGVEGVPVREGRTYCVGSDGRLVADDGVTVTEGTGKYAVEVQEPVGQLELLVYWTTEPEQQPESELAMDIDALDEAIEKARGGSGKYRGAPPRETQTVVFEIVP